MKRYILLTDEEIQLLKSIANFPGLNAINGIVDRATRPNTDEESLFIDAAKNEYAEQGSIEFDDAPLVSGSDEGAYVAAWVWVSNT